MVTSTKAKSQELVALEGAIKIVGSKAALAREICRLGMYCTPSHIHNWVNRDKRAPAEACRYIEAACKGKVTREQLREDVFGIAPNIGPENLKPSPNGEKDAA